MTDSPTDDSERLYQTIEETNDLLEEGLNFANKSAEHGEMRPSTHLAFKKMEEAMEMLTSVDPTRQLQLDNEQ